MSDEALIDDTNGIVGELDNNDAYPGTRDQRVALSAHLLKLVGAVLRLNGEKVDLQTRNTVLQADLNALNELYETDRIKELEAENARLKERNEQLFGEANRAELTIQDLRARLREKG